MMLKTDLNLTAEIRLYYDLHIPKNVGGGRAPLLIAVHGYGAHKNYMMRESRLIAYDDFVIAAIQAPYQFYRETPKGMKVGFGWLTNHRSEESVALHHKFVLDVIERLDEEGLIDTENIFLYGFSQACALNFRFALTHPDILRGVIGVCGGIPSDLDTSEIYRPTDAKVLYLYGDRDEFYPLEKFSGFAEKLKAYLPDVAAMKYSAEHEITEEMRGDMKKWLAVTRKKEKGKR